MGGAEGVVDVGVGQGGQAPGKIGVVVRFTRVETQILQQQDFTRSEAGGLLPRVGADGVGGELHRRVHQFGQTIGHGAQTEFGIHLALGPTQMAHQDQAAATREDVPDRGQGGP